MFKKCVETASGIPEGLTREADIIVSKDWRAGQDLYPCGQLRNRLSRWISVVGCNRSIAGHALDRKAASCCLKLHTRLQTLRLVRPGHEDVQ